MLSKYSTISIFFLTVKVIIKLYIENLENVMKYREEVKNESSTAEGTTICVPSPPCFPSLISMTHTRKHTHNFMAKSSTSLSIHCQLLSDGLPMRMERQVSVGFSDFLWCPSAWKSMGTVLWGLRSCSPQSGVRAVPPPPHHYRLPSSASATRSE